MVGRRRVRRTLFSATLAVLVAGLGVAGTPTAASAASTPWSQVSAGFEHTCGVKQDRTLWCWGDNSGGELGLGTTGGFVTRPTRVGTRTDWWQVSAGTAATCALTFSETRYCWGGNSSGQLGLGDLTNRSVPTARTDDGQSWQAIAVGDDYACGINSFAMLYCWGYGRDGQLGLGDFADRNVPTWVSPRTDWASVTLGSQHACALTVSGTRACWGTNNNGQLGTGADTSTHTTPVLFTDDGTFLSISAGDSHTCARSTGRRIYCWGNNYSGQLGVGDTTARTVATRTTSNNPWGAISAGGFSTCGLYPDGTRFCWGDNEFGQLGIGDTTNRKSPIRWTGDAPWASLSVGLFHTCGIHTDGTLACWGDNIAGQLGTGDFTQRNLATPVT